MAVVQDTDNNKMIVAIVSVDLVNKRCSAHNQLAGEVTIRLNILPSGNFIVPAVGEQWIVEKNANNWFLCDQLDFQDARLNLPLEEGLTAFGGQGPTYITGKRVEVPQDFWIGGVPYAQTLPVVPPPTTTAASTMKMAKYRLAVGVGTKTVVPNAAAMVVPFATEVINDNAAFTLNVAGNTQGTVTCNRAGRYRIKGRVTQSTAAQTLVQVAVAVNTFYIAANSFGIGNVGTSQAIVECEDTADLVVGDKVDVRVYYGAPSGTANSAIPDTNNYQDQMTITWVA